MINDNSRILITGGTGSFGKAFIKKIRGHKIKNKIIRFMKFLLALIKFDLFLIK